MTAFPHLFSPIKVGPATFKNRIFSTGHMTCLLDGFLPDDRFVAYHEARARGGAGLIITEAAALHWTSGRRNLNAGDDACIPGYQRTAEAVHAHGCAIFGQLGHGGVYGVGTTDGSLGVPYGPSEYTSERSHMVSRALSAVEIADLVKAYGAAAARMKRAGLDGVEILSSHSLLPAQFLNPHINRRTDAYGGSLENRMRFLREVIASVRDAAGGERIVGMRISGDEMHGDGGDPDELMEVCRMIGNDGGLDYLNVIAGSMIALKGSIHVVPPMNIEHGYLAPMAHAVKKLVDIPVFVAGRINQPQEAENIIAGGQADMCGMTRAQICDPEMANKAKEGRTDDIRACIACNQACIGHMQVGLGISCIQHPETGREVDYGERQPTAEPRKVMVIGGGPAGMKAAAVAAERGHDVTLYEATGQLGGQAQLAQMLPGRAEFGGIVTNLTREMEIAGVKVQKNTAIDMAQVEREAPDAVILATGALPRRPEIEGADEAHIVDAWAALKGEANVGSRVVVADWRCDWIGLGMAEKLARDGCSVTLAVDGYMPGQRIQMYVRDRWVGELHKLGVDIVPYARLFGADADSVYLQHATSGEPIIVDEVDTLVTSLGHTSVDALAEALENWSGDLFMAGDCLSPRTCEEAVLEGLKAGVAV
ncbi:MAG: FAD-dependent oxidoreductase [Pseudomonadota bacterium]